MTGRSRARRVLTGVVAILAALTVLLGLQACSRTVEGQAQRAGAGDVPRNNDSEKQYPNLLKECDVLTQDILDRCARRAPEYDRENRFFHEDFEELRSSGYLLMAVPVELGGLGLSLAEVCRETARLAYYAPATALATKKDSSRVYGSGLTCSPI